MGATKWFKGIRGKLLILTAIPFLVIVTLYYQADYSIGALQSSINQANNVRGPSLNLTGKMAKDAESLQRYILNAVLAESADVREIEIKKAQDAIASFEDSVRRYEQIPHGVATGKLFNEIHDLWKQAKPEAQSAISMLEAGQKEEAREVMQEKFRGTATQVSKKLDELSNLRLEMMVHDSKTDAALVKRTDAIIDFVGIVGMIASLALSIWISYDLSRKLVETVVLLTENSTTMLQASQQLFVTSEQVAQGATESAASIEETVASLEEVNSMVQLNSESGQKVAEFVEQAVGKAQLGENEVASLAQAMKDIEASSKQIEAIVAVIDNIAFQTNLLSLNASIEAARAGEQGKGFSAVAEAVRALAHSSAKAAKEIAELIHQSSVKISTGVQTAENSARVFQEISATIHKVSQLSLEVARASHEQAQGVGQINKAMNLLDTSTQVNSAASEEVAVSAQELSEQARALQNVVKGLSEILDGKNKGAAENQQPLLEFAIATPTESKLRSA
ncbi:MAG: methyl-accepting chemotaxis protein [Bdellovibrio sp.]|nr:methyl-accepting chemotaxis protein [Bdellovibrio sp.]